MRKNGEVHFNSFFQFESFRDYRGSKCCRGLRACTIGIVSAFLLIGLFAPSSAYGSSAVNSYMTSVFQLIQKHRAALPDLSAPANATADALIHGGAFYLGGDRGWVAEGVGRAGGPMIARPLIGFVSQGESLKAMLEQHPEWKAPVKGDVVWLAYTGKTYPQVEKQAKELEKLGCLVVAFGPKPASGTPDFTHWINSFTSPNAPDDLTEMGNVISLWTMTGEVAAATSRQGKTLVFWQSVAVSGSNARNAMYKDMAFQHGFPQMRPIPAGVLSAAYLNYIQRMLENIREWELPKIIMVGQKMARRSAEGRPVSLMVISHLMPYLLNRNSKWYHYVSIYKHHGKTESKLRRGGYLVFIGYVGVDLNILRDVREAGAKAAWIIAPLHSQVSFSQFGDIVISQHWHAGDCAVQAPGYDIRILPPSAVAQLFIYELLLRAAQSAPPCTTAH